MSDAILRADAVSKEFVLARNLLGRPTRVLQAVRGVSLSIEARRHAGAGRRIGLGQEHTGPLHRRPAAAHVRQRRAGRP